MSTKKRTLAKKPDPLGVCMNPAPDALEPSRKILAEFAADGVLTANGVPLEVGSQLPFAATDQGIASANVQRNRIGSGVQVKDGFDMQIEARIAAGDGKLETWESPDPLTEAAALAPVRPQMRRKFLSPKHIDRRGRRGFEIVTDPKTGQQIKVADMILAEMPIVKAEKRNAHYREEGNSARRDAQGQLREQQEKLIRDGKVVGIQPLNPGETVSDRSHGGEKVAVSGLQSHRGNSHFLDEGA